MRKMLLLGVLLLPTVYADYIPDTPVSFTDPDDFTVLSATGNPVNVQMYQSFIPTLSTGTAIERASFGITTGSIVGEGIIQDFPLTMAWFNDEPASTVNTDTAPLSVTVTIRQQCSISAQILVEYTANVSAATVAQTIRANTCDGSEVITIGSPVWKESGVIVADPTNHEFPVDETAYFFARWQLRIDASPGGRSPVSQDTNEIPSGQLCSSSQNDAFTCPAGQDIAGELFMFNVPLPPGAAVLTGTAIDAVHVQLTWTVAPGATGGYNLTRCDLWGYCVRFDFGPTTFAYTDGLDTTNRTWYVQGWNMNGTGPASNNVTMKQADQFLFADDGPLFGPGAASLSGSLGVSQVAVRFAVGSMIIMILTAGGYLVLGAMGASAGAFLGAVIDIVVGFFPPWFGFLLIAVATACVIGFYTLLSAGRQTQKDVRKGRF